MFDLLFKNAQLVCEDYILSGDIAVKDGAIRVIRVIRVQIKSFV